MDKVVIPFIKVVYTHRRVPSNIPFRCFDNLNNSIRDACSTADTTDFYYEGLKLNGSWGLYIQA